MLTDEQKRLIKQSVFISYRHVDHDRARKLVRELGYYGGIPRIWWDERIRGGDVWRDEILRGMHESKVCVLLVTQNTLQTKESDYIWEQEIPHFIDLNKRLIAFILDDTPYDALHKKMQTDRFQLIRVDTDGYQEAFRKVLRALLPETQEPCSGQ
jgi:hypothetical protein